MEEDQYRSLGLLLPKYAETPRMSITSRSRSSHHSSSNKEKEEIQNPWKVFPNEHRKDIVHSRVVSSNPIGSIPRFPTAKEETGKSRYVRTYKSEQTSLIIPPSEKIRSNIDMIKNAVAASSKGMSTEFIPCKAITGIVKRWEFSDALEIYENNQLFYQERLEEKSIKRSQATEYLSQLEEWFICIIEPKPLGRKKEDIELWVKREKEKLITGVSPYCNKELHKYIRPLPEELRGSIMFYHRELGI